MFEAIILIVAIYLAPTVALLAFAYGMDRWVTRSTSRDAAMSDPYGKVRS